MKIREDHCPYCGSKNITYEGINFASGRQLYRHCCCNDCGHEFEQWYELTFTGMNIGDELTTWVDKDQNI